MYMTHVKTALVKGLQSVFDSEYPDPQFRNLNVSIEWPVRAQDFPGIWVDYEPTADLRIAGIDHIEFSEPSEEGARNPINRWRFGGMAAFTLSAMTSLERDKLFDAVVSDLAFEKRTGGGQLRQFIESNPYIAMEGNWDEIGQGGMAASMGTPWNTDDTIYEVTIRLAIQGEFISDETTGSLLPLEAVEVYHWNDQETDPVPDGTWY